jgi:rubrerythrin
MSLFSNKKNNPYWIQKTHLLKADEFICSACGYKAKSAKKTCPNCGTVISKVKYDASWAEEAELLDAIWDDD